MKPMKESAKTVKAEIKYMKKGGAPKALIKHEQAEHRAMKRPAKKGK